MHSNETAVLKVLSNILLALDSGNLVMLTLLDLSAAFDSVDHVTLLKRLHTSYGLDRQVINWFAIVAMFNKSAYRRPAPHHLWFCTVYHKD